MTMDCNRLAELAPELALEILTGDERATALEHLDGCAACQELLSSYTLVTDRLLLFAPQATPPAGFERRVLGAVTPAAPTPAPPPAPVPLRRRRFFRRGVAALAVASCAVLVAIGLGVGTADDPALAVAEMRTSRGEVVGEVIVRGDDPASLFLTLPGWADQIARYGEPGDNVSLRIEVDDGQQLTMPVTLDDEAAWAQTIDVDPDAIASVALVDANGYVWCSADL